MSLHAFARSVALTALLVVAPKAAFAETASQPWPISIRNQIDRIGNVEYRLRKSAANLCSDSSTLTGIKLDYIDAYATGDQQVVREYAGLGDAPQIISVATGSPAESAGVQVGDDILSVNGVSFSQLHTESDDSALLADQIEERLAATPRSFWSGTAGLSPSRFRVRRPASRDSSSRPGRGSRRTATATTWPSAPIWSILRRMQTN